MLILRPQGWHPPYKHKNTKFVVVKEKEKEKEKETCVLVLSFIYQFSTEILCTLVRHFGKELRYGPYGQRKRYDKSYPLSPQSQVFSHLYKYTYANQDML